MYRLSNIKNDILQRVISNEMAAGFLRTFGVTRAVEHLDIGDFGKGIIKYLLNTYSGNDVFQERQGTVLCLSSDLLHSL